MDDSRLNDVNRQRVDRELVNPKLKNEAVILDSWTCIDEKKEFAQTGRVYFEDDVPEEIRAD